MDCEELLLKACLGAETWLTELDLFGFITWAGLVLAGDFTVVLGFVEFIWAWDFKAVSDLEILAYTLVTLAAVDKVLKVTLVELETLCFSDIVLVVLLELEVCETYVTLDGLRTISTLVELIVTSEF